MMSRLELTVFYKKKLNNGEKNTHCNAIRMLIPDSTTIGSKQYPRTETTAPRVTAAWVAITLNSP